MRRDRFHRDHDPRSKPVSILVPGNGCTLEKCGLRLRTGCLLFDAGVEWRLSFLPTVGCSWPVPSPALAASREPTTTADLCYYRTAATPYAPPRRGLWLPLPGGLFFSIVGIVTLCFLPSSSYRFHNDSTVLKNVREK